MDLLNSIPLIGPVLGWVLPFIVVLSIVVAIHELGHLMVGRWCGIRAEVYSIGFGKVIWSRVDKHGTVWQVALLPFGGYVKFLGDMDPASAGQVDDSELAPDDRRYAFHNAALWKRTLTVLAGPVANFILSIAIIFGLSLYIGKNSTEPVIAELGDMDPAVIGFQPGDRVIEIGGKPTETFRAVMDELLRSDGAPTPVLVERQGAQTTFETRYQLPPLIGNMEADGAALAAGLRVGDIIRKIDGTNISSLRHLQLVVADLPHHKEIQFTVERGERTFDIAFTPKVVERIHPGTGEKQQIPLLGVHLATLSGITPELVPVTMLEAADRAVWRVWKIISDTMIFIHAMLFQGADTSQLAGPIGIAKHSANAASQGLSQFILFTAFVSTAIGLFNLFPIPILDGGHLVFYLVEAIRGKPSNDAVVRYSTMAGLSLLILLMVFVTFNNDLGLGDWFNQD